MTLATSCLGEACADAASRPFFGGAETTGYRVLLALHILAIIGAFGPTFLYALLRREAISRPGADGTALASLSGVINARMSMPALGVAAIAGICLVMSSGYWAFSDAWVSASFSLVLVVAGLMYFILRPAQRRLAEALSDEVDRDERVRAARASAAMATGLIHLGLALLVVLMIWTPGA